jgi:hypothetical protein
MERERTNKSITKDTIIEVDAFSEVLSEILGPSVDMDAYRELFLYIFREGPVKPQKIARELNLHYGNCYMKIKQLLRIGLLRRHSAAYELSAVDVYPTLMFALSLKIGALFDLHKKLQSAQKKEENVSSEEVHDSHESSPFNHSQGC